MFPDADISCRLIVDRGKMILAISRTFTSTGGLILFSFCFILFSSFQVSNYSAGHVITLNSGFSSEENVHVSSFDVSTFNRNPQISAVYKRELVQQPNINVASNSDAASVPLTVTKKEDNYRLTGTDKYNEDKRDSSKLFPQNLFDLSAFTKKLRRNANTLNPFVPDDRKITECSKLYKTLCSGIDDYPKEYVEKLLQSNPPREEMMTDYSVEKKTDSKQDESSANAL